MTETWAVSEHVTLEEQEGLTGYAPAPVAQVQGPEHYPMTVPPPPNPGDPRQQGLLCSPSLSSPVSEKLVIAAHRKASVRAR